MQNRNTKNQANLPDRGSMLRLISYLTRYRSKAMLPYLFLLVATLAQIMIPRLVRNIIDAVVAGVVANQIVPQLSKVPEAGQPSILAQVGLTKDQLFYNYNHAQGLLLNAVIAILGFAILRGVFYFLQVYWAERNSQGVAFDLRNELFAKIQSLSFSYHDRNQTGQLMVRATDDVEKVRLFLGQGLLMAVGSVLLLVSVLVILAFTNFKLTLVVLPILPIAFGLFAYFGRIAQPLFQKVQRKLSAVNTVLQENLAGIKVVKAFTREPDEQAKFQVATNDLMGQQIQVAKVFGILFPVLFLVGNLGQAMTLYFGGQQIIAATLSLGEWQEFSLYLVYMFMPLAQLGFIIAQMSQATASAERIFEILDTKNEVTDRPGAIDLPPVRGEVLFEKVGFRYFKGGEAVLKVIDVKIEPGKTVALLGATGSGKTSIINLIPRFYDPTEGRILIDGHDLREVTLSSLRSQIGIVLQETTLFSGTIRENIAFGKPDASNADVIQAAKAAAAHEFITSFPEGYDTLVGERGATLSGGQKQRLAIARALLLDPRILIMDDSTSSVDLATEAHIQIALDRLMKGRTSFVIAQRISTVMNADLILVLEAGEIVARGAHAELMESSEIYADIYHSQLIEDTAVGQPALEKPGQDQLPVSSRTAAENQGEN